MTSGGAGDALAEDGAEVGVSGEAGLDVEGMSVNRVEEVVSDAFLLQERTGAIDGAPADHGLLRLALLRFGLLSAIAGI